VVVHLQHHPRLVIGAVITDHERCIGYDGEGDATDPDLLTPRVLRRPVLKVDELQLLCAAKRGIHTRHRNWRMAKRTRV